MTNKEELLLKSAQAILQDQCPFHAEYYFCKKYVEDSEESRCMECWNNYLLAIVNGVVEKYHAK